jgi:16S rRNA U516 pseudouridylate synthase RsuA-like enzyme
MRLNRYISASGAASRRKGENIIRDRQIAVNGEIVNYIVNRSKIF